MSNLNIITMKKLVFKEGSITPFWMKDLEYLQDGVEEAIGAIARGGVVARN